MLINSLEGSSYQFIFLISKFSVYFLLYFPDYLQVLVIFGLFLLSW